MQVSGRNHIGFIFPNPKLNPCFIRCGCKKSSGHLKENLKENSSRCPSSVTSAKTFLMSIWALASFGSYLIHIFINYDHPKSVKRCIYQPVGINLLRVENAV